MRHRLLHVLITLTVFTVAWLVVGVTPAFAAPHSQAPQCDHRAAITFAPPPQVQALEVTLDIVLDEGDCTPGIFATRECAPDRVPPSIDFSSQDLAGAGGLANVVSPERVLLPAPAATERAERPAVRTGVERPPRS